ncbi:MAG: site-2 protease family protein [Treponema sp.]|nr:site-2 protease family protein [Treponema sp.]
MSWMFGIICLIFLIIFHELGHFIAAKICGVKVESFSVGFGPVLLHKTIKGTDYRLSLIPLGGYCGMKGEKDFQKALEQNLPIIEAEKDSLYGVHPLKRAFIAFSGPLFNFFLCIIAFTIINISGYTYETYSNKIIIPDADDKNVTSTAARDAGLKTDDIILEVNGNKTDDFSSIVSEVASRPDEDITLKVNRNGEILTFVLHTLLDKQRGTGSIGIMANQKDTIKAEAPRYRFFPAIYHGIADSCKSFSLTLKGFSLIFKGINLKDNISGPIRTTQIIGLSVTEGFKEGIRNGFAALLSIIGIINISLFVMNLLPIPVLDGGLILLAIIEFVIRRKINTKVQLYIQYAGLAVIILIAVFGIGNDLRFLFTRH